MSRPNVLITGCGQGGIGEALATEFQNRGCEVITTVLPWESRTHLEERAIKCYELDVTKDESIERLRNIIEKETGGNLNVLVNNAGICYTMTACDTDVKAVQKMFDVNVFGPMRMVAAFHPFLIRARGTIVNIGSVGGMCPYIYGSSYNASKAALHHWGNTVRVEMAPLGVHVLNIISGEIGTNILKSDVGRQLPADSYYVSMNDRFAEHCNRTPDTTDRFTYARNVVHQALKPSPPAWFWTGKTTSIVRFLDIFGFRTVWDYIFWQLFGLGELKKVHEARVKGE